MICTKQQIQYVRAAAAAGFSAGGSLAGGFVAAAFSEATGFSARCVAEEGCFFASASVVQERKLIVRYNKTICKTNEGMHSMYSRSATFPEERSDMAFAGSAFDSIFPYVRGRGGTRPVSTRSSSNLGRPVSGSRDATVVKRNSSSWRSG